MVEPSSAAGRAVEATDLRALFWTCMGIAVVLQLWLWSRSWLYFDQILLYRLATDFALSGELYPVAKGMSGGAVLPGSLLQLVLGAPLFAWFDFRSPTLFLVLLQLLGLPLVYRSMRELGGVCAARLLTILYALAPWRLYHGGYLWEPSFLVLLAPLHFWAFVRLRTDAARLSPWWPSLVLGWAVVAAPQLHPSGVIVGVGTALLLALKQVRPNWWALMGGGILGASTLIGTLRLALSGQLASPTGGERINLFSYYVVKPLTYWFRIPSSDIGRRIKQAELPGAEILAALAALTIIVLVIANWKLWQRLRNKTLTKIDRYALIMLAASLISHAFSGAHPQGWHSLIVLLPATLPLVSYLGSLEPRRRNQWLAGLLTIHLFAIASTGLGHPMFKRPTDPQELEKVSPANLPHLELVPIPFGSGKENWDAARKDLLRRRPSDGSP